MRRDKVTGLALCVAVLFLLTNCAEEPKLVSNQGQPQANANAQAGYPSQAAAPAKSGAPAPGKAPSGEAIDTSEYDARVSALEEQAKKKPKDEGVRKQLAKAYLARANALTQARQYQAALGDYRRTLRYDPENEEARYWSGTIIGILQQMNREVPAEGSEPAPLKL